MNLVKKIKLEILFFIFFVILHSFDLGHDNFNTDVWKWKQRSYDFGTGVYGLQFEKTFQKYHPGVTLMWVGSTGVKISNLLTQDILPDSFKTDTERLFLLDRIQKSLLVILIGLVLSFSFYVVRNLFGSKYAIPSFVLMSLEPFYLGLTRVFHLEGLMSTLMLSSVLWLYYFFQDTTKKSRFYLSAVFGGLAVLTKTSSLFLLPFVGFALVFLSGFNNYKDKISINTFKKPVQLGLLWFAVCLLVFVVLWPVMWVNPLKALTGLYEGIADVGIESDHSQIYFGQKVADPGTLYYFVVLGLRSSVWLLFGFLGSIVLLILKKFDAGKKRFVVYLIVYSGLYFAEITVPSKKLDRYLLPSILTLSLVSTMFFYWITEKWSKYKYVITTILVIPALMTVNYLHYDYLSYYNPVFGGLKAGMFILEPKWLIGQPEIMNYFMELKKTKNYQDAPEDKSFEELIYTKSEINNVLTVGFQEKYYTQIWPFFREKKSWSIIQELRPFATKTRYFVYPVWNDESEYEFRFKLQEQGKIYKGGIHMYTVYERVSN